METMIAGIADRLRKKKSLEYWKKSQMREVIEDYYRRNGDIYNCEMLQYKKMIPEIKESFDTGVFYADRNELTDVSLYEKEFGYPLPEEIAAYINCCWHGYIYGFEKKHSWKMVLFPVYQEEGKQSDDILLHSSNNITLLGMAEEWKYYGDIKHYIPIGLQDKPNIRRFILYERETGKVYLESVQSGVPEITPIAINLKEFIKNLNVTLRYKREIELDKNASMKEIIQNYYERMGDWYIQNRKSEHMKAIPEIREVFKEGIYYLERDKLTDLSLYKKEFGYSLPEEVADYINSCWHSYICGYYKGKGQCIYLCAVFQKEGETCDSLLYRLQGIFQLTKQWKEYGGDIARYVVIGWMSHAEEFVLYDRKSSGIYYENVADMTGNIQGPIASSLRDLILHLE